MISTKKIYKEICNSGEGYILNKNDLIKLQNHLIKMYRDIERVCRNHGIEICLAYGNVIGAVRHNGWIPWDDDLDIHMKREDYDKFLTLYSNELPENYKISSYLSPEGSRARFAKIIDIDTVFVSLSEEKTNESGCFIDIFPIDNVPLQSFRNKLRKIWTFFLMYTAGSVMQVQINSKNYKKIMYSTSAGRNNWRFRQIWGKCFSFFGFKKWNAIIERFGQNKKHTGYIHVVAGQLECFNPMKEDVIFPFKKINLPEIGDVNIPNKPDEYLTFNYGNWHHIPSDIDKWHHYVREFKLSE